MKKLIFIKSVFIYSTIFSFCGLHTDAMAMGNAGRGGAARAQAEKNPLEPLEKVQLQVSPFDSCRDLTMIRKSDYQKNKALWDKAINECGVNIEVMKDSGFFEAMIGHLGDRSDAGNYATFLQKVGSRTEQYLDLNNRITENLIACAKGDESWFKKKLADAQGTDKELYDFGKCKSVLSNVKKNIQDKGPEYRINRYVVEQGASLWGKARSAAGYFNKGAGEVLPLSAEEKLAAEKIIAEDNAAVEAGFQKAVSEQMARLEELQKDPKNKGITNISQISGLPSWFKGWYRETSGGKNINARSSSRYKDIVTLPIRNELYAKRVDAYLGSLQHSPILAYLGQDVSNDAIALAAAKVLENGRTEKDNISATIAALNREDAYVDQFGIEQKVKLSAQQKAESMMDFMKYGPVIREILKEDPKSCAAATGLTNYLATQKTARGAATAVGALGVAVGAAVVGPAVLAGTALAGLSSGALATAGAVLTFTVPNGISTYSDYVSKTRAAFSKADSLGASRSIADIKDAQEARDEFVSSMLLSPLDLIGSGAYAGAAGLTIGKMLEKPGLRNGVKAMLQQKGKSTAEVDKIMTDLASKDATASKNALRELTRAADLDESDIQILRTAAKKGVLNQSNRKELTALLDRELKHLPIRQRKEVAAQAINALEAVNPGKVRADNRRSIMEMALAGARFGHDPKKIASTINDWDEGLGGLAKTYQLAMEKLNDPAVKSLRSIPEKQDRAFKLALREQIDNNPELAAKSSKEKDDLVEQMAACGLKNK